MNLVEIVYKEKKYFMESSNEEECLFKCWKRSKTFYELKLLEEIKRKDLRGIYIDLGANIGNHSVFFATQCKCEKLYCIEASNIIAEILEKNIKRNVFNLPYRIYVSSIADKKRRGRLSEIDNFHLGKTRLILEEKGDIETVTIDDLFEEMRDVVVLKMDIEGSELMAIKGAKTFLRYNSPLISAEFHDKKDFEEFKEILKIYGYQTDGINYGVSPTYIFEKKT